MSSATSFLGFGFNVFGKLALASGTTQSVIATEDNVATSPVEEPSTQYNKSYTSREKLTEEFAASVDVKASGWSFDGEFSAKYGSQSESTVGSVYGLYRDSRHLSQSKLLDLGLDNYSSTFSEDPDVQNIPSTFTPKNADQFYRIFRRYGTHFVSSVSLGAKLTAYTTAQTSESVSEQDAEVSISAEYDGLFSASADAKSSWKKVAENWDSSRELNFEYLGGKLDGISTEYGTDSGGIIKDWLESITPETAGIVDWQLTDISNVFPAETAAAVEQALDAYFASVIRAEAWQMDSSSLNYASTVSLPNGILATQPHFGFGTLPTDSEPSWVWLLLLDPVTLKPLLNASGVRHTDAGKLYATVDGWNAAITTDIESVRRTVHNPVVVMAMEYGQNLSPIPAALQQLSEDCGFDLQGAKSQHQVLSFIGTPNVNNAAVVTTSYAGAPGAASWSSPARSVGQYLDTILVAVDQDGVVLSPLESK